MFIGHFGIALGAKRAGPLLSLGVLFIAAQFLDLLWPVLLLLNIEHVTIAPGITKMTPLDFTYYPISHSLLLAICWGLVFGFIYWLMRRNTKNAIILFVCVISHWLLDAVVHRPDLPLYPGHSPLIGLGLWNNTVITIIIEAIIFAAGISFYLHATAAKNRSGKFGLWVLIALLLAIYIGNLFGPAPVSVTAIAWTAQLQWVLVILAFWVDHNRTVRAT